VSDLIKKAEDVIPTLGYEERVTGDLRAALVTRLDSLRQGGKGAMLDVSRSFPLDELFSQPTVIELEGVGDAGDKAFLAALLLVTLGEHRRVQGRTPDLRHLLIIEEAHRLLANAPTVVQEDVANPQGEAVQTFANLLSEIRAYGQGVIVADQIPVRLAPDVIKNTDLKIAHRVVSADDREVLAGAMAMDESQARALTSLGVGEAAVFSSGDDAPLLVKVPEVEGSTRKPADDARVIAVMNAWRAIDGREQYFLPRPFCAVTCAQNPVACAEARRLVDDHYVQRVIARTVLSLIEDTAALDRLWQDVVNALRARRPTNAPEDALLRSFAGHAADWYAGRRGNQGQWSYDDTEALAGELREVLLEKVEREEANLASSERRASFQAVARRLNHRAYPPYFACEAICTQHPPQCLYRAAVADLVASRRYQPGWREADARDAEDDERRRRATWQICQDAAYELIEFPESDAPSGLRDRLAAAARRTALCFEQQMLADDERKVPRTSRNVIARVIQEAAGVD
jgi:hypothetical protein